MMVNSVFSVLCFSPFLNASKTHNELSNTGSKVHGNKCQIYLGVINIKMMANIETGNYMAEGVL